MLTANYRGIDRFFPFMTLCLRQTTLFFTLVAMSVTGAYADATAWPPVRTGLAFAWSTAFDDTYALDSDGNPRLGWEFAPKGRARLNHDGALVIERGGFTGDDVAGNIAKAVSGGSGCTVILHILPHGPNVRGTILRLGSGDTALALDQAGDHFRGSWTAAGVTTQAETVISAAHEPIALALRVDGSTLTLNAGGAGADSVALPPNSWTAPAPSLVLGTADDGRGTGWTGTVQGIAIYSRALPDAELETARMDYAAIVAARKPVPAWRIRARLSEKSTIIPPDELAPYTQGLTIFQYEVLEVLSGDYQHATLHVAHWTVLDRTLLPFAEITPGADLELQLELLDDNPQLESENLSDDAVMDFTLPYFYDAGGYAITYPPPER